MNRRKIIACAATGVALTALAWFLPAAGEMLPNFSADTLSRSAGVALLGIALIAAGLAFHATARAEKKSTATVARPQASEYRRGFGDRFVAVQVPPRRPAQQSGVIPLRRPVAEEGRAGRLSARNAELSRRRFTRGTVYPGVSGRNQNDA